MMYVYEDVRVLSIKISNSRRDRSNHTSAIAGWPHQCGAPIGELLICQARMDKPSKKSYAEVVGDSGHGSDISIPDWTYEDMSKTLCWLSECTAQCASIEALTPPRFLDFFTIDRDRPGVFLGTYLLLEGWPEGRIGVISFIKDIVSLFFQTPMVSPRAMLLNGADQSLSPCCRVTS